MLAPGSLPTTIGGRRILTLKGREAKLLVVDAKRYDLVSNRGNLLVRNC